MKKPAIRFEQEISEQRAREDVRTVSDYFSAALVADPSAPEGKLMDPQLAALARILSGPMWEVLERGRMPTVEDRNARR